MMLRIKETDDQKVYVASDFHLGHNPKWPVPIWEMRGFKHTAEHDAAVIESVNARVRPNDILLYLGDFCLNTNMNQFESFLAAIQCENIWSIWGNHNNPHEKLVYRKIVQAMLPHAAPDIEVYPIKYKNLTYFGNYVEAIINGQYCVLCHYPITVWDHMKSGSWMLCGHSHCGYEPTTARSTNGKILDCGWDDYKKPLSFDEIKTIMDKKKIVGAGHHMPD